MQNLNKRNCFKLLLNRSLIFKNIVTTEEIWFYSLRTWIAESVKLTNRYGNRREIIQMNYVNKITETNYKCKKNLQNLEAYILFMFREKEVVLESE